MRNKFSLPTVGRSYRSYQERLRASKKAVAKRRGFIEVVELAVLVVVAILIASLYGCGKEEPGGPIGYPGATPCPSAEVELTKGDLLLMLKQSHYIGCMETGKKPHGFCNQNADKYNPSL